MRPPDFPVKAFMLNTKRKYMKFGCRCAGCKAGRKSRWSQAQIRRQSRHARRVWNRLTAWEEDESLPVVSFGYLD